MRPCLRARCGDVMHSVISGGGRSARHVLSNALHVLTNVCKVARAQQLCLVLGDAVLFLTTFDMKRLQL